MSRRHRRVPRYQQEASARARAANRRDQERNGEWSGLPTADEINVYDSLDERCALEHFLGKSRSEAESLFHENECYYFDDLMCMGPKAFVYYVPAAINHIKSDSAGSNTVSLFSMILEFRLQISSDERNEILPSFPALREAVQYVLDHWEKFDVDPQIHGDLKGKYTRWLSLMTDEISIVRGKGV